jgi:hypothetical protein
MNKPKHYLALDWDDIVKLENRAIKMLECNSEGDEKWIEGKVALKIINWMKENNIYTRPFKSERNELNTNIKGTN